jgi:GntR family transcriptional regulator/MocR family aminotransferase
MNRPLLTPATSEIGIDRADSEAIQSQIARQIREFVLSGRLRPQAKLPSTRGMAEDLKVARATVVEAYEQLLSEGYIEARKGSGTRVAAELPEALLNSSPARLATGKPRREKGREPAKPFRSGLVDWEHFPHDEWGRLLGRFWRNPPIAMLEHNDAFGWLPLREAIARHLYEWRGISCEPPGDHDGGRHGCFDHQSLHLQGGDKYGWKPGYPRHGVFSWEVKTVAVPVDREGIAVVKGRERAGARGVLVARTAVSHR